METKPEVDEVIEALKLCLNSGASKWLVADALSVIETLKAENERLRGERDTRDILVKDLTCRNNELQSANEGLGKYCLELEAELKEILEEKLHRNRKN